MGGTIIQGVAIDKDRQRKRGRREREREMDAFKHAESVCA